MKLKGSCHCQSVQFEVESDTPYPYMHCYCSICRKTAGGSGSAINIMGSAKTLKVKGKQFVQIYQAHLQPKKRSKSKISRGRRHFCKHCASFLWISDPEWPELIHPFASAIDTKLPTPKENYHIFLNNKANWCVITKRKGNKYFKTYPKESIEEWHKRHKLYG